MEADSPVKRLIEEFPALSFSTVQQANAPLKPLSDFEANDYGTEEMTDLVETLRKSVSEALGRA